MNAELETDYLVVGAGAAGMAFTDALLAHSDATVTIVDRRHAPGGHWIDAYPYVRLHQPSTFYGVSSVPLGQDAIDTAGTNAGFYELAGADEIRAYYAQVMQRHFLPSGRVRYFPNSDYLGEGRFVSRLAQHVAPRCACGARSSTPRISKVRFPRPARRRSRWPTAFAACPRARSRACRTAPSASSSSARARRPWTPASGCWNKASTPRRSAGSGHGRHGG